MTIQIDQQVKAMIEIKMVQNTSGFWCVFEHRPISWKRNNFSLVLCFVD